MSLRGLILRSMLVDTVKNLQNVCQEMESVIQHWNKFIYFQVFGKFSNKVFLLQMKNQKDDNFKQQLLHTRSDDFRSTFFPFKGGNSFIALQILKSITNGSFQQAASRVALCFGNSAASRANCEELSAEQRNSKLERFHLLCLSRVTTWSFIKILAAFL